MFCKQLFDLAMLSNKPLNPEEMTAFYQQKQRDYDVIGKIIREIKDAQIHRWVCAFCGYGINLEELEDCDGD